MKLLSYAITLVPALALALGLGLGLGAYVPAVGLSPLTKETLS